jgi:hypothetical protein
MEEVQMLGFGDSWVFAAYALCILSSILCVVYGALNWNKGDESPHAEDKLWAAEEEKLEEEF